MKVMYDYMKRANLGENRRATPCLIEVSEKSVSECEQLLTTAQYGLGNETHIEFRPALREIKNITSQLSTGIHYIVYKKRKVASWPSSQAGYITKVAFFLYDADVESLYFCGFLRTRLKHDIWEHTTESEVQTGISVTKADDNVSRAKTFGIQK